MQTFLVVSLLAALAVGAAGRPHVRRGKAIRHSHHVRNEDSSEMARSEAKHKTLLSHAGDRSERSASERLRLASALAKCRKRSERGFRHASQKPLRSCKRALGKCSRRSHEESAHLSIVLEELRQDRKKRFALEHFANATKRRVSTLRQLINASQIGAAHCHKIVLNLTHAYDHDEAQLGAALREEKQLSTKAKLAEEMLANRTAELQRAEVKWRKLEGSLRAAVDSEKRARDAAEARVREAATDTVGLKKAREEAEAEGRILRLSLQTAWSTANTTKEAWDSEVRRLRTEAATNASFEEAETHQLREELNSTVNELAETAAMLRDVRKELEAVRAQAAGEDSKIKSLEKQQAEMQQVVIKDASAIDHCKGHAKRLRKKWEDAHAKEIRALKKQKDLLLAENKALKAKITEETKQDQELTHEYKGLKLHVAADEEGLDSAAKKREALKASLTTASVALHAAERQRDALLENLTVSIAARKRLVKKNKALKEKLHVEQNWSEANATKVMALLKNISLLGRQQERSLELQHENIEDEKVIKFQQQGFAHKYEALVGQNQQLFEENKNLGHELDVENATLRNVSEQKRLLFAELKRVRLSKGSKLDAEHKERLREKARNAALEDQVKKLEGRASAAEARSRDLRRRAESAELRAKRTSGTRPVLAAAVFNALDENGDKRVTTPELRILAQALGFKGEQHEWEEQYKELLRDHHMDPEKGVQNATFMELVNDEADPRLHCTDEELVVLLGKLSVAAVRPEAFLASSVGTPR